jgi:membrane protease YdiL (CAAX protease family)
MKDVKQFKKIPLTKEGALSRAQSRVLLGAALGMMVSKTRNIGYPILAHGLNNLLALVLG